MGSNSIPSLLGHHMKELLWFHPTQKLAKLRHIEMARSKEEGQGLPVLAMQ